ncbi:hypothetical protein BDV12DRAFT_204037 [Aspergillus spectabilis]
MGLSRLFRKSAKARPRSPNFTITPDGNRANFNRVAPPSPTYPAAPSASATWTNSSLHLHYHQQHQQHHQQHASASELSSEPAYTATHNSSPSPPTHRPPTCRVCQFPLSCLRVKGTNTKGNANRPYFRCDRCGDFRGWADNRGVFYENPLCHCGLFSRVDRAGRERGGAMFYACAARECRFYTERNWMVEGGGSRSGRGSGGAIGAGVHEM